MFDIRQNNIDVFCDTEKMCKNNHALIEAIETSNRKQQLIKEADLVEVQKHRYDEQAKIIVSKKRSLEASAGYAGLKVCVHNFASATNPGGGVTRGSNAQEEAICRCSSLYFNLNTRTLIDDFYNKHRYSIQSGEMTKTYNDDCIFTPGVCVFKTDTTAPELLPEENWYKVDVITCAAPNLREYSGNPINSGAGKVSHNISNNELFEIHVKRMSRICDIAAREKEEVLILGAFGCGAFSNSPQIVAEAMAKVVEKYKYDFKVIEFAVFCSKWDTENYKAFSKSLG